MQFFSRLGLNGAPGTPGELGELGSKGERGQDGFPGEIARTGIYNDFFRTLIIHLTHDVKANK